MNPDLSKTIYPSIKIKISAAQESCDLIVKIGRIYFPIQVRELINFYHSILLIQHRISNNSIIKDINFS